MRERSTSAPLPLRLLTDWEGLLWQRLTGHLVPLKMQFKLNWTIAKQPLKMLHSAEQFHILLTSAETFASWTDRQKLANRINLLILAPDLLPVTLAPDDLEIAPATIALNAPLSQKEVCDLISTLLKNLVAGQSLPAALPESPTWLLMESAAIWPPKKKRRAIKEQPPVQSPTSSSHGINVDITNAQFVGTVVNAKDVGSLRVDGAGNTNLDVQGDVGYIRHDGRQNVVQCQHCNTTNRVGQPFCNECGGRL